MNSIRTSSRVRALVFLCFAVIFCLSILRCTPSDLHQVRMGETACPSSTLIKMLTESPEPSALSTPSITAMAASNASPFPTCQPSITPTIPPTPTWGIKGPGMIIAPILLYHHVEPDPSQTWYVVDSKEFEMQMEVLSKWDYQTITIAQLREAILYGAPLPLNPVIITFDDGNVDNYEHAFPIMKKYGFTGTLYIVADRLGMEGLLSKEQLMEMKAAGWEIGSHSMTHADLTQVSWEQLREEVLGSRLLLEDVLGVEIRSIAYPYGNFNAAIASKIHRYGYFTAVGIGKNVIHDSGTLYYLNRQPIDGKTSIEDFEKLLESTNTTKSQMN